MPASSGRFGHVGPRERIPALAAAAVVQTALALVLLIGLRVPVGRAGDVVQRLIDVQLPPPPILRPKPLKTKTAPNRAAPRARGAPARGPPAPARRSTAVAAPTALPAAT